MLRRSVTRQLINDCVRAAVVVLFIANAYQARADQSIVLRSGNGLIGSQDAQVRFLAYHRYGNITPTAQDFITVQTGTFAYVDTPYTTYIKQLTTDPLAQWLGTTPALGGGSALYAIPFMVTDSVIAAASLYLGYAVDNAINGVYINGMPISNNPLDGDYHSEYYVLRSDIAPLLKPNSVNWLYMDAADYGYIAGLIFSATITTQGAAPGEPTISPTLGGNTGQVSVRVIASGFEPNAQIKFTGSGPDINGTNVIVVSPNILTATMDLTNATPGVRTVVVTNPDHSTVTLSNAFTVQEGGAANVQIQKIGTPAVDGRNETFYITLTNSGTVDAGPTPITELMEPWFTFVASSPTLTSSQPVGYPWGPDYNGYLEWTLPNVAAGQSVIVSYTVALGPRMPVGDTVNGPTCEEAADVAICKAHLTTCLVTEVPEVCVVGIFFEGIVDPVLCAGAILKCYGEDLLCDIAVGKLCASTSSTVRGSVDPNDLTGPQGYENQGWFRPSPPLQYVLSFNNLPGATNPATNVYLTDTFDPTTQDLSSLTVGAITFGSFSYTPPGIPLASQPFSHDIDLRPAQDLLVRVTGSLDPVTHQVAVNLVSLDPATGLTPTDPTVGFLAPGEGGGVVFTVVPKGGLTTGTQISDQGTVVFDLNPPMSTAVWKNTVDNTPPTSKVLPLPGTESCANFQVAWSGNDVGAGVQNFTVFVSDNGGRFRRWLINADGTSWVFKGRVGHTYGFYSTARDFVANVEPGKHAAEAHTKVTAGNSCGPPSLSGGTGVNSYSQGISSLNLHLSDIGTADALNVKMNQVTFRTLSGVGQVTLVNPTLPVSLGNISVDNSSPVALTLKLPRTVNMFSVTESGTMQDSARKRYKYSVEQVLVRVGDKVEPVGVH